MTDLTAQNQVPKSRRPIYISIHFQILGLFTAVFVLIFGLVFYWGYQDALRQTHSA